MNWLWKILITLLTFKGIYDLLQALRFERDGKFMQMEYRLIAAPLYFILAILMFKGCVS